MDQPTPFDPNRDPDLDPELDPVPCLVSGPTPVSIPPVGSRVPTEPADRSVGVSGGHKAMRDYVVLTDIRGRKFTACPARAALALMDGAIKDIDRRIPLLRARLSALQKVSKIVRAVLSSDLEESVKADVISSLRWLQPSIPQVPDEGSFAFLARLLHRSPNNSTLPSSFIDGDGI